MSAPKEKRLSILLIEDDDALANAIDWSLTEKGYSVIRAATFAEGEAELQKEKPDLILLDLGLPCRSIEKVILSIKDLSLIAPVVVLTGRNEELYAVQAFECGASGFLRKPISIDEFILQIESVYKSHKTTERIGESAEDMQAIKKEFRKIINEKR